MPSGISYQGCRGVEPHRLTAQQGRQKDRRIVELDPGRGVNQPGETQSMRLGKPEIRERFDAGVNALGCVVVNPIGSHPLEKFGTQRVDTLYPPLGPHSST